MRSLNYLTHVPLKYSFLVGSTVMNTRRKLATSANSTVPHETDGCSHLRGKYPKKIRLENDLKQPNSMDSSGHVDKKWPSLSASAIVGAKGKRRTRIDLGTHLEQRSEEKLEAIGSLQLDTSTVASRLDECSLPTRFGKMHVFYPRSRTKHQQTKTATGVTAGCSDRPKRLSVIKPFDICHSKNRTPFVAKAFSHTRGERRPIPMDQSVEDAGQVLRPGMVLLKGYISIGEQADIVKHCRDLGLGPGGFYQPRYQDGAKLRLQMMCLGLNWDPQTKKYEDRRPADDSKPPAIPFDFLLMVKRVIKDSHDLIKKHTGVSNVECILPGMSPNICIVNFYTTTGRLGLHQDRDESKESLYKGLPVVSFSIGDSAEFLYGDRRDVDKAEKVLLQSGDVLIFGGNSRQIFHGVSSIIPNSAPSALLEQTDLRPGRLNLTFRQF